MAKTRYDICYTMVITVCLKKAYWDISHSLNTEKIKKNIQWRGEGSMI